MSESGKRRFVVAGTGTRGTAMWIQPMLERFADDVEPVGLFDINPGRARACNKLTGGNIPVYESFDEMLEKAQPDALVVATTDATHAEYVVKGAAAGLSVYCEKPLCTSLNQVKAIRAARSKSDKPMLVTHNMRYYAAAETMKREIMNGRIGEIKHVIFIETLDRFHGADYFRRWHREIKNSGGLLVQKGSHHFDLVNWMVGSKAKTAVAQGSLSFYGKNGPFRGERCSNCSHAKECFFYADLFAKSGTKTLFNDIEQIDGYYRDRCVFGNEIDIYDTMNVTVQYENGVHLAYSLIAYASYEGMRFMIEGTKGRLEWTAVHGTSWAPGSKERDNATGLEQSGDNVENLVYFDPYHVKTNLTPESRDGSHGGADPMVQQLVYGRIQPEDQLGQKAELEDGIQAVLIALAANKSIELNGQPVTVQTD
ncbi:MAG: Gfo/Idh/MocA family oxidoreductase [Lentisphaerae bacterium]|nr:Gfo/Idh/MocA family oxidoreductase [Lentisphaerota bacterium]